MTALLAVAAFALLLIGAGVSAYAKLTLINFYKFEDYLTDSKARRLYWTARVCGATLAIALMILGWCSGLWWVATPLFLFAFFALYRNAWGLYMRFSGRHVRYYRERGWR